MSELNDEQKRVVEELLRCQRSNSEPSYKLRIYIAFRVRVDVRQKEEYQQERARKEATIEKLIHDVFPHWVYSKKSSEDMDHQGFIYRSFIDMNDDHLSLIALAYLTKWLREGHITSFTHPIGPCEDPRYDTAKVLWKGVDPVQWVTDTYGDTLDK